MNEENNRLRIGDNRSIIIWGIIYVVLTYLYPVFFYLAIPKVDESVTSQEEYSMVAKVQNGPIGENLPFLFLLIPIVLAILNIIIVLNSKAADRLAFLRAAKIIKYLLIPFYIMGAALIVILFLLIFTPIVFMLFCSPPLMGFLSFMGYISMAGASPLMIAYLRRGVKDGQHGKVFAIMIGITQFFFGIDVLGTAICGIREKSTKRRLKKAQKLEEQRLEE